MCAIVKNVNADQAMVIVNHGFFKILHGHVELISASPNESLEALFNLRVILQYLMI
jgi:hypothetical protein